MIDGECPLSAVDSTDRCNTLVLGDGGVLQMKQRRRIYYSESQKALMWQRWKQGNSLQQVAGRGTGVRVH